MTIDPKQTYTTRSGLPVRIYAVDGGGRFPVHGAILEDGVWRTRAWTAEGSSPGQPSWDLLPAPREWKRWVAVTKESGPLMSAMYDTRDQAVFSWGRYPGVKFTEVVIREPRDETPATGGTLGDGSLDD